ncbi:MAG: hypothetical protein COA79_03585 [Planctomycetota bacterium]|nr:MAG: hypothetical protein COA79_03585 [Planctomycetota bacterium]
MDEILIIDDNEDVTNIISIFLKEVFENKYSVTTFNDPELALKYYNDLGYPIYRVILDLCMPKISGEELIQLIRQVELDQPITIMTGRQDMNLEESLSKMYPEYNILRKPFTFSDIKQLFI